MESGQHILSWTPRSLGLRTVLCLLTPFLLTLSFPDFNQFWLAWIALTPLLLACWGQGVLIAFGLGLLSGFMTMAGICHWIFQVNAFRWYHGLILGLYLGLYPAVWCGMLSFLRGYRVPFILAAPTIWVALDYLKAHAFFLAFPWATLAHSQHANLPVLQWSTLTGEAGITFLIVLASAALAEMIAAGKWTGMVSAAAIILLVHGWGALQITHSIQGKRVKVAVIQPCISREERGVAQGRTESFLRLKQLTYEVADSQPALVVWPETAVRNLGKDVDRYEQIETLARFIGAPILTGASEFGKFPVRKSLENRVTGVEQKQFNSAYFITGEGKQAGPYHKWIRVPFAEYVPLDGILDWPDWLVPERPDVMPGNEYQQYPLGEGLRIGPLICWENLFAGHVRILVNQGNDVIVQLTNDNWFGSTAAPWQHNAASVLRAVENRVFLVIASNTGPSQIIDPFGYVTAEISPLFKEGVIIGEVKAKSSETFFTRRGELFALLCISMMVTGGCSLPLWRTGV
ncbi:MAG: apolipoprotein N-acyltransferase [Desulfobacterales bacterium]|nr:MAG: apolipoprotein N-acyltransferase [Desulfobacterales bacterium]